jgi:aspartate/methionine/tyrosine aminotransferase
MKHTRQDFFTNLISSNVAEMKISAIKEMAMLSARTEGAVSLSWGLPSFTTPEYIREGVIQRLRDDPDIGKYSLPDGLPELREIVAQKHLVYTGVKVDPDEKVMITAGNMQAFNTLFHVIIDPGDEIILTDPCFASHIQQIKLCGGTSVYWALDEENDWELDMDALPGLINGKTKAIVIVSPSNPTGKIFSKAHLTQLAELAREHRLLLLVDDPYHHFCYENRDRYFNPASIEKLSEHIAYCYTFSKAYAMSGWRMGYMIIPAYIKERVLRVHDANIICAPRISQVAAHVALTGSAEHLEEFEAILAARRELICARLDQVSHVFEYIKPEGAYYIFPRIVADHYNARDFAIRLLKEAKVAVTPGSAFGPSGEHHVRMAYCVDEDMINMAFDRIEAYFK